MVTGPDDEPDPAVNGDGDSHHGDDDESGYDDMPVECGWEDDEGDSDEDDACDDDAGGEAYDDDGDDE
jgi:hypothetical protein